MHQKNLFLENAWRFLSSTFFVTSYLYYYKIKAYNTDVCNFIYSSKTRRILLTILKQSQIWKFCIMKKYMTTNLLLKIIMVIAKHLNTLLVLSWICSTLDTLYTYHIIQLLLVLKHFQMYCNKYYFLQIPTQKLSEWKMGERTVHIKATQINIPLVWYLLFKIFTVCKQYVALPPASPCWCEQ